MGTRRRGCIAEEQAALRRVAVLVARRAAPEEVFAAVAAEAGRLLGVDLTAVGRYEPDGVVTLGAWSSNGAPMPCPADTRTGPGGQNLITRVFQTGQPVRMEDYGGATGAGADVGHGWGYRAAVGVPIRVEGRLWGVMAVGLTREERLPADAESRLAGFTELAATAIANAPARVELRGYAAEQAALRRRPSESGKPGEVFIRVAPSVAPHPSCALARPPDSVTSLSGEVTGAMVMNPRRSREVDKRQRWSELIHTLHAALVAAVCFAGGCVAMMTGHVGSGEAGVIIGGVLAVLCLWDGCAARCRAVAILACGLGWLLAWADIRDPPLCADRG